MRWTTVAAAAVSMAGWAVLRCVSTTRFGSGGPTIRRVVGLGDSVPAGTRAEGAGYVELLGERVHQHTGDTVVVRNLAVPGLTSRVLGWQLLLWPVRDQVRRADLLLVTIGANDFSETVVSATDSEFVGRQLERLRNNGRRALGHVSRLRHGDTRPVVVTGYWNVFSDGAPAAHLPPAHRAVADRLTLRANDILRDLADEFGMHYVDLYVAFKGDGDQDPTGLLAADGDHPNAAGHQRIAATIEEALQSGRHDLATS